MDFNTGFITKMETFYRRCARCVIPYRYMEHEDGLHNFNDHLILTLQLCEYLGQVLQNNTAIYRARHVLERECDVILWKLNEFVEQKVHKHEQASFESFNHQKDIDRLDTLLYQSVGKDSAYKQLWQVFRLLLILSHGQASVEKGFSINKEIMVKNMREESFVGQRLIQDYVSVERGIRNIKVTQSMLTCTSQARHRYHQFLEDERKKKSTTAKNNKERQ